MKKFLIVACAWLLLIGAAAPLPSASPSLLPAASPSPLPATSQYNDPGMHFEVQPGWTRVPFSGNSEQGGFQPLAIFVLDQDKAEQKTLIIAAEPYQGTLEGFEITTENELRSGAAGTFVDKKMRIIMPNGMPAYWMKVSRGDQAGKLYQTFQYAIFDGKRGIIASVSARLGEVREEQARDWLAGLRVVLYPRNR